MAYFKSFGQTLATIRDFMWPDYRPERHYMRGPGPACARRQAHG
ncbi:MAG: hypothetical protein WAU86_20845 [Oricola sp.]